MGFKFRKSIKLGCGVRINFSKSGIGYSIGGRGFRTTVSPKGRVTNTFSIPGTGLSYSTRYSASTKHQTNPKTNSNSNVNTNNNYQEKGLGENVSTVSADIGNFQNSEYSELISKINTVKLIHTISTVLMVVLICLSFVITSYCPNNVRGILTFFLIAVIIGLKLFVYFNSVVDLDYDLDAESAEKYAGYCSAWALVCKSCSKKQQISSSAVTNKKIHSGANSVVDLKSISIDKKLPSYIKTNVEVYVLRLFNETLCLLPDKILIIRNNKIGAINYDDVNIKYNKRRIIDTNIYRDSEKVGETWKYVNKSGGPDKRYKDNVKLNICLCGEITLTSTSGLNVILVLSNNKIIDELNNR